MSSATTSSLTNIYLQGKSQQPAVDLAKTFERRRCNHREPIPGDDCLLSVVVVSKSKSYRISVPHFHNYALDETNKHRYVVATQSAPLRSKLRKTPAVPIVHINRSVMILEPVSDATQKAKEAVSGLLPHMYTTNKRPC